MQNELPSRPPAWRTAFGATSDRETEAAPELFVAARGPLYVTRPRAAADRDSRKPRLDGVQILLVEDDADLLDALTEHLRGVGASVVAAASVKAALSALADAQFDLLVSDLGLPDGSGHEVAIAARDGNRVRAALALTGERGEDVADATRTAGFQMHLTKPCDPGTLVRVAQMLLEHEN